MENQLETVRLMGKWYAKPQVLVPAAAIGYLLLNKKTRKKTLQGGGAILLAVGGFTYISSKDDTLRGLNLLPAIAGGVMLALGYFSKSK
jgi:hypothetical protein